MTTRISHTASIAGLISILGGLRALDGYIKLVKDASGEKAVQASYHLSGLTRLALAENIATIENATKAYQKVRGDLLRQHADDSGTFPETAEGQEASRRFNAALQPVYEQEREVQFTRISVADLDLERNPIPGSAIAALMPILVLPERG